MRSEITKSVEDIFSFLGYKENILSIRKCSTRLRLNLADNKIADIGQLKKVDGVLGIVETREQFQIIIHSRKAKSLINEFIKVYKIKQ